MTRTREEAIRGAAEVWAHYWLVTRPEEEAIALGQEQGRQAGDRLPADQ